MYKANDKKKRYNSNTSYGIHLGAIDVDATFTAGAGRKGTLKDKLGVTCYNCSKKGHLKREYCSPKKD